jgi:hypothetical protein
MTPTNGTPAARLAALERQLNPEEEPFRFLLSECPHPKPVGQTSWFCSECGSDAFTLDLGNTLSTAGEV